MNVIRSGVGIAGCVPGPMAQGDCATIMEMFRMRLINPSETALVSGGELTCSVGFPSGVKCEGTLSDWKQVYDGVVEWTSRNVIEPLANLFK